MSQVGDFGTVTRAREILRRQHRDNRCCTKCSRVFPLEMFPEYRSGGYEGRRHQCRDCVRAYRTRWELELTPDQAGCYYARKRVTDARSKRREQQQRYRDRRLMLKSMVGALIGQGMTRREIASRAGLADRTIRRILNGSEERTRFLQPTEDRIVALFLDVKEQAA